MPINRPDGRHWCAPEREPVQEDGAEWTCPDCGTTWCATSDQAAGWGPGLTWETVAERDRRVEEQAAQVIEDPEEAPDGR